MNKHSDKVEIIAEIGVNHNGSIPLAKKLVKIAKHSGADFVKFQNWKAESLVTKDAEMASYQKLNTKKFKQIKLLKPLELKDKDYFTLFRYCNKNKIKFLSSPFDELSYEFLSNKLKCKIIKIPSGEINNFLMLNKVNLKKQKVLYQPACQLFQRLQNVLILLQNQKYIRLKNNVKIRLKSKLNFLKKEDYYYALCNRLSSAG